MDHISTSWIDYLSSMVVCRDCSRGDADLFARCNFLWIPCIIWLDLITSFIHFSFLSSFKSHSHDSLSKSKQFPLIFFSFLRSFSQQHLDKSNSKMSISNCVNNWIDNGIKSHCPETKLTSGHLNFIRESFLEYKPREIKESKWDQEKKYNYHN